MKGTAVGRGAAPAAAAALQHGEDLFLDPHALLLAARPVLVALVQLLVGRDGQGGDLGVRRQGGLQKVNVLHCVHSRCLFDPPEESVSKVRWCARAARAPRTTVKPLSPFSSLLRGWL